MTCWEQNHDLREWFKRDVRQGIVVRYKGSKSQHSLCFHIGDLPGGFVCAVLDESNFTIQPELTGIVI